MLCVCHPKILHKHFLQFLWGVKLAPRETENNAYATFWGGKQRALWYVMVYLEWSIHRTEKVNKFFAYRCHHYQHKHPYPRYRKHKTEGEQTKNVFPTVSLLSVNKCTVLLP